MTTGSGGGVWQGAGTGRTGNVAWCGWLGGSLAARGGVPVLSLSFRPPFLVSCGRGAGCAAAACAVCFALLALLFAVNCMTAGWGATEVYWMLRPCAL